MAVSFFSERFIQEVVPHADVGIHALQSAVLLGHSLYLSNKAGVHPAILRPPFVKRGAAHAMFTAQLGSRHTALHLAQYGPLVTLLRNALSGGA